MKRTNKTVEFNCARLGDYQPRWHTRQVYIDDDGNECVIFYGEVLTLEYIEKYLNGYFVVSL